MGSPSHIAVVRQTLRQAERRPLLALLIRVLLRLLILAEGRGPLTKEHCNSARLAVTQNAQGQSAADTL